MTLSSDLHRPKSLPVAKVITVVNVAITHKKQWARRGPAPEGRRARSRVIHARCLRAFCVLFVRLAMFFVDFGVIRGSVSC